MSSPLEDYVGTQMTAVTGDPVFGGILVLLFFVGIVMVNNSRLDVKLMVIVPAFILALVFLPLWVKALFAIAVGFIVFFGIYKMVGR